MKTDNYTQFAKKTLLLGLDRSFLIVYLLVNGFLFVMCSIFDIPTLGLFIIGAIGYAIAVIKFAKDVYWFDKWTIKYAMKRKYKFLAKTGHILSR